ncbi:MULTISPECIES: D-arabinono-1,4-lactone oxidase [unclassified Streptomyces]|uniref:D-arabinono-1,4-lactone oxidase n=1 Tax=unclassified Streptomyces TaxID=2593676 RepID=UPI0022711DD4|nr:MULTISPECIES: D-arabinono-1,4-lactone oxidase [unclassified Streptomyces]MCY0921239.1 FAD-binding protein [Streptomyces sp. H27-G5]MCY0960149.1 FAD-binding protein [Streptomyces sp. H27-H5]
MGTATAGQSGYTGAARTPATWRNWAGNVSAAPARVVTPTSVGELQEAVRRAAEDGLKVKAVGTGHSFTAAAATDGVLIRPQALTGIRAVDRTAGTVTVAAGTVLKDLNQALAKEGLSLTNMGDIMEQTVSGATSTGTHGTGRDSASLSAQIRGLELVTADGRLLTCSEKENPEVFAAARLGIGALGILTSITLAVEPLFFLTAREEPMPFDRVTAEFDEHFAENEHFEFYWFPHTGNCNTKRNNRSQGPAAPPGAVGAWVEDELLSNGVFQAVNSLGRAVPAAVPGIARIASRALSARTYTDIPYKVFTSPRRVRFVEMEYALPRERVVGALRELKAMVDGSDLRVSFPVEVRTAPADDVTLSTASGRETAYIAVHMYKGTPYEAYFTAAERIFTAHGGRPHWGKVHTRDAEYLAGVYPRFTEFTGLRDRLDPDRVFGNDYLRRVLGS